MKIQCVGSNKKINLSLFRKSNDDVKITCQPLKLDGLVLVGSEPYCFMSFSCLANVNTIIFLYINVES
jgi:hypothetical protein